MEDVMLECEKLVQLSQMAMEFSIFQH